MGRHQGLRPPNRADATALGVSDGAYLTEQEIILDHHGFTDRARLDRQVSAGVEYLTQKRLELTGEGF